MRWVYQGQAWRVQAGMPPPVLVGAQWFTVSNTLRSRAARPNRRLSAAEGPLEMDSFGALRGHERRFGGRRHVRARGSLKWREHAFLFHTPPTLPQSPTPNCVLFSIRGPV